MRKFVWILLIGLMPGLAYATVMRENSGGGGFAKPSALPNTQLRVHDVGKLWLSVTNFGFFGSQDGEFEDASGKYLLAPGCQFPGGSNKDYLFQGALWIGAERERDTLDSFGNPIIDTLVSIGNDGWWGNVFEMYPASLPAGEIEVRSIRPSNVYPFGDTADAISEQDYVAVYFDTSTSSFVVPDPNDQREHIPLGLRIEQRSYSWSYEYAEDFVLFDFDITNIGILPLSNVWLGMYIDADVAHSSENPYAPEQGAQDDICGFRREYISPTGDTTTINTAWIADNDGQVYDGTYDYRSPRDLSGVRVVRTPSDSLEYGFNWWISNTNATYDWGPQRQANFDRWGIFPGGGRGTPGGDRAKYQVMSNSEFDYDQIWCNLNGWQNNGWIQKSSEADDLANGYDTRYLFSFGPFPTINIGETLKLTTGYICGENLHNDPSNYTRNLQNSTGDSSSVSRFYDNLDFLDFATNAQWADWVYDNPGVDTAEPYADLNGDSTYNAGEPYRDYDGNGVYTPADGYVGDEGTHFNITPAGDTFWFKGDGVPDFQGPPPPPSPQLTLETSPGSVTLSWDGTVTETLPDIFSRVPDFEGYKVYMSRTGQLGDYTLIANYDLIDYDSTWLDTGETPPVWKKWTQPPRRLEEFAAIPGYGPDFDPDTSDNWVATGWNRGLATISEPGTAQYSYTVDGLSETIGLWFAVTAYDFGNPVTKLSPLESSQTINAKFAYPIAMGTAVTKVQVYPNPYKISDVSRYVDQGIEDPDGSGNTQFDRRIKFANLPGKCVIRIFTLDGDLVKQIDYDPAIDPTGVIYWDLISRNTQAVVSGIYIYSVDSDSGHHELGKIAIIK